MEHAAQYLENIIQVLEDIAENANCGVLDAVTLVNYLKDKTFKKWLLFFSKVLPHAEILFAQIQHRKIDSVKIKTDLNSFKSAINNIKLECSESELSICNILIKDFTTRFEYANHLILSNLLLKEDFAQYDQQFPDRILNQFLKAYPNYFEKDRLKTS